MSVTTEASIWQRLIRLEADARDPESAAFLLRLEFSEEDRSRMTKLATKAGQGQLSIEEESQLESYRRVGYVLDFLRSWARSPSEGSPAAVPTTRRLTLGRAAGTSAHRLTIGMSASTWARLQRERHQRTLRGERNVSAAEIAREVLDAWAVAGPDLGS